MSNREVGWGDLTRYICLKCERNCSITGIKLCGYCNYGVKKDLDQYAYCHECIDKHLEEAHGPVDLV